MELIYDIFDKSLIFKIYDMFLIFDNFSTLALLLILQQLLGKGKE